MERGERGGGYVVYIPYKVKRECCLGLKIN
jgi:hypothetical protein